MGVSENEIGKRIFQLRTKLGLSQALFGKEIGIQQSSVSAMENGTGYITAGNLQAIAESYDVNLNWLFMGVGPVLRSEGIHIVDDGAVTPLKSIISELPQGLTSVVTDKELCNAINLTMEEVRTMRDLAKNHRQIFDNFRRDGFLELLVSIRKSRLDNLLSVLKSIQQTI